jgi:ligand-binding sensor domain-containing protein
VGSDLWTRIYFVDEVGTVWATADDGLMLWDPPSGRVDTLSRSDGLLDELVYEIVRAPDGLLWLATYGGANTWDGERLGAGLTRDLGLLDKTTWDLWVQSDGTIWMDTNEGYVLTAFDGTGFRHFSDASTAERLGIEAVFPARTQFNSAMTETPDGTLWFGSNGNGLFAYDGVEWRRYTQDDGLPSDSVDDLAATPDGRLWISAIGGLTYFDGTAFTLVDPAVMGDWSGEYPDDLVVDHDGALWVMTMSSLFRYVDGDWEMRTQVDGLTIRVIYSLVVGEDGSVWISTADGVARYGLPLPLPAP